MRTRLTPEGARAYEVLALTDRFAYGTEGNGGVSEAACAVQVRASCENSPDFSCVSTYVTVVPAVTVAGGLIGGYGVRALAARREP